MKSLYKIPLLLLLLVGLNLFSQEIETDSATQVQIEVDSSTKIKAEKSVQEKSIQNQSETPTDSKTAIVSEDTLPEKTNLEPQTKAEENQNIESENPRAETEETTENINPEAEENLVPSISEIISWPKIFSALLLLIIAHFIIKLLVIITERLGERSVKHRMNIKGLSPIIRITGWLIAIFIVIHGIFQPPIETLLAVTASVGIAVGFAAQDILKNIFGGIMILFDRPFQVGDKIQVGDHYGEVKEIGLRSTRIITKDDSMVSVPNAEVVNTAVSNSNVGEANCQVVAEIFLPIHVDTNLARRIAIEAAQVSQYIYLNKPIAVLFINEVRDRKPLIKMRLKAYVSDIRYEFAFQSDMTEIVIKEFIKEGLITDSL